MRMIITCWTKKSKCYFTDRNRAMDRTQWDSNNLLMVAVIWKKRAFPVYLQQGGFAPGEAVHLTQEQAEALRWATSAEGKFDRDLIEWNSDSLTNLECKKDVKRLGVTLEVAGRPTISGFCTIWVESVEKRKFSN